MLPDLTAYQDDLKLAAVKILKDPYLAEDMVQDALLYALEKGVNDKKTLLDLVRNQSLTFLSQRRREPETFQTFSFDRSDGLNEEVIWRKQSAPHDALPADASAELSEALTVIKAYKGRYLTFAQAKIYLQSLQLDGEQAYRKYILTHPQINLPLCPKYVYEGDWTGWRDFLGFTFYTFEEFLTYVRTVLVPKGIDNSAKWNKNLKSLPLYIPTNPHIAYKDQWKGWGHVFQSDRKTWGDFLSYDEAKAYVQENLTPKGIDTLEKYKKQTAIPSFLPHSPNEYYVGKGWVNSADFFGTQKVRACTAKNFLPYKEAREWVRLNLRPAGITTGKIYYQYLTSALKWEPARLEALPPIPDFLPLSPLDAYRKDKFSWGDFLGTLVVSRNYIKLFSYEECKVWIAENLKSQIKGQKQFERYLNGDYKELPAPPDKMPLTPYATFTRKKTWVNWEDFLGLPPKVEYLSHQAHKARKKGKKGFWSYDKARQYMIDVIVPKGITSLKEYLRLKNKPATIPLDPKHYYAGKGWIDVAHFMGLEDGTYSRKKIDYTGAQFLSYEEAKLWIKNNFVPQGITSYYQYRQNRKLLPSNMPILPHIYYKGNGWIDIYDFMGKISPGARKILNPAREFMSVQDASRWVQENLPGINDCKTWRLYISGALKGLPALHPAIPKSPHTAYGRKRVWKGWAAFLTTMKQAA